MSDLLAAKIQNGSAASRSSSRMAHQRYRNAVRILLISAIAAGQIGCAALLKNTQPSQVSAETTPAAASWLKSGSLALSRPVPTYRNGDGAKKTDEKIAQLHLPSATIPSTQATVSSDPTLDSSAPRIIISRSERTITALNATKVALSEVGSSAASLASPAASANPAPLVFPSEGAQNLKAGSFSITLKEESPLWYAPNEYFTRRKMSVPEEGSRARFMRAALGSRALYLNDQTPIHSGPVWLGEIGGVRIKESEMQELFSLISVGTRVEVR